MEVAKPGAAPRRRRQILVYPDGSQGGETDMARRMRIGHFQGALLWVVGLREIEPSMAALQTCPLRSWDEVDYVREKMRPAMEKKFLEASWCSPGATRAGCASTQKGAQRCAPTTTADEVLRLGRREQSSRTS